MNNETNKKAKPFETILGSTTLIIGALYFYGWIFRYLYYAKFNIQTVVFEMPMESFLFCGFGLTLAPLVSQITFLGFLSKLLNLLLFFGMPLLMGLLLIVGFDSLHDFFEHKNKIKPNKKLYEFLSGGLIWFLRDISISALSIIFLYFMANYTVNKAYHTDIGPKSNLPIVSFLTTPESELKSTNIIYHYLDGKNKNHEDIGKSYKGFKCTPEDPCHLLLRHNNNLYLIKTDKENQRQFKGTFIVKAPEINMTVGVIIE